jgi:glycosyltransferase involved in cell wall biosynthesis
LPTIPLRAGPLRIALISTDACALAPPGSPGYGGANVYVATLALELARAGALVDLYTRHEGSLLTQRLQWRDRLRVIQVPAGAREHPPGPDLLGYLDEFARCAARFIRRARLAYHVVHACGANAGAVARHLKILFGIPYIVSVDTLGQVRKRHACALDPCPSALLHLEAAAMRDADRLIALCAHDRREIEHRYGTDPARVDVLPCGFNPQELWPVPLHLARKHLALPRNRFVLLHCGRIAPH